MRQDACVRASGSEFALSALTLDSSFGTSPLRSGRPEFDLRECYRALGFEESPFSITPDTDFFFPGSRHLEALDHLRFGIANGGLTMLTGEVGLGKTLLCRCLLRSQLHGVRFAYLLNPDQNYDDLLKSLYEDLTGTTIDEMSVGVLQRQLYRVLLELAGNGERVAVLIDEAHRLTPAMLESLRLLSNLDTEKEKLLCLIFVGQPELERTLKNHALRPLAQRISVRYRLEPFGWQETMQYIHHRLAVAASSRSVKFDVSAIAVAHVLSKGVPRRINQICDRSLFLAYARGRNTVSASAVWQAATEVCGVKRL